MFPAALPHTHPLGAADSPFDGSVTLQPKYPDRLLRISLVEQATGQKKSTLYEMMRAKKFPDSVRLTSRTVAWRESEVQAWIAARPKTGESHE